MKENKEKLGATIEMADYQTQLKILLNAQDEIMIKCGLIFPAAIFIQDAITETLEALKSEALVATGISGDVERAFNESSTNHNWNWLDDFKEWRKERGGVVNRKRNE
jgi:hypothetical protein